MHEDTKTESITNLKIKVTPYLHVTEQLFNISANEKKYSKNSTRAVVLLPFECDNTAEH